MTEEIDARIVLGGRVTGFQGRFPGVAEEALLTISEGKPGYLLGGFGGCARRLAEIAEGQAPEELSLAALRPRDPDYTRLLEAPPNALDDNVTAPLRQV